MYYYLIAPTTLIRKDQTAFTYHSEQYLKIGTVVGISAGRRTAYGIIIADVASAPSFKTKPVEAVYTQSPIPTPLLQLAQWLAQYYATHLSDTLALLLPTGLHKTRKRGAEQPVMMHRKRTTIVLNNQQRSVLDYLKKQSVGTYLLHGVTGSGKTQIYIELAKLEQQKAKSTIILVPEIALTPQLVAEFRNHFDTVIVTHSGLTESQRHRNWQKALESTQPVIVVGPRSALFMPVRALGLIVVDESHEPSYKQEQSPRYSALRAATILAKAHNAKAVFGTATPNVSEYYLARAHKAPILKLTSAAIATEKPAIAVVDNRNRDNFRRHPFFSDALISLISAGLKRQEQSILFHNRRGTAPAVLCTHCGWSALCASCRTPLTLHADKHLLICHLCNAQQRMAPNCPECRNPDIVFRGIGTKLIEEEIQKLFPAARVARFDADNMAHEALQARYQQLYNNEVDIIIGTQLVAKGLDLPRLTTVGIIQADNGLYLPDFQAEERVFQLIHQVIGRVGRTNKKSNVVVQTYVPDNHIINFAVHTDYDAFYEHELATRRTLSFPPFAYLLKLTCSYKTEQGAIRAAQALKLELQQKAPKPVVIVGPVPAFHEFLGGNYRWQLLLKSKRRADLTTIALQIPQRWQVDIDPTSLL